MFHCLEFSLLKDLMGVNAQPIINTRHKLVFKHLKYRDIVLPDDDDGHQDLARQYLDNSSYLTPGLDTLDSRPFLLSDTYTPHAGWQTVLLVG